MSRDTVYDPITCSCLFGGCDYGPCIDDDGCPVCSRCGKRDPSWVEPDPDYDHESCWHCFGAGGFHDCGEDCCPCAFPDLNETCPECHGTGWV